VRWRLARLPDGTGHVLDAAAVAGAEFDADVLADVIEVDLESALDALEAAERARLVRSTRVLDRFAWRRRRKCVLAAETSSVHADWSLGAVSDRRDDDRS
jgi:predicted ATPase